MSRFVAVLLVSSLAACSATSPDQDRYNQHLDDAASLLADASLCKVDSNLGDVQTRIAACSRLIARGEPKDAVVAGYNNRALLYRRSGRKAEALEDLDEAIRLSPEFFPSYVNRGDIFSKEGKLELAEQDFRSALALAPNNLVVLNNFAWVLLQRGDYAAGLVEVNRALASEPEPRIGYDTKAHALMGLGQVEAAEDAFRMATEVRGADLVLRYQVALARKGYDPGRSDGVMDDATQAALSACIRDNCRLLLD